MEAIERAPGATEQCVRVIRAAILEGVFRPGDLLPAEREMAARLEVNRQTLRAALARLTASGLLRVKQGSGYRVAPYFEAGGPELLPALVQASAGDARARLALISDLLLARRHIAEAALTKLCSMDRVETGGVIAAVDDLAVLVARGQASPDQLRRADLAVIAAILDATGSAVFRLMLNPVAAALAELPELCAVIYRQPRDNLDGYRALLVWLEARAPDAIPSLIEVLTERDRVAIELLDGGP